MIINLLPLVAGGLLLAYGWQVAQPGDLPFFYTVAFLASYLLSAWVHRQAIRSAGEFAKEVQFLLREARENRQEIQKLQAEIHQLMTERTQALTLIASLTAKLDKNSDPEL